MTIKNQKNAPNTSPGASESLTFSFTEVFKGVDKAIIKKEKITAMNNRINQGTPNHAGPEGDIQSCPDQPTRKMIGKNKKNALQKPRLVNKAPSNAKRNATKIAAAGAMKSLVAVLVAFIEYLFYKKSECRNSVQKYLEGNRFIRLFFRTGKKIAETRN